MTTETVALEAVTGHARRPYVLTEVSLVFDADVTFEQWYAATVELMAVERGASFWLADALAFGSNHFEEEASAVYPTERWSETRMESMIWTALKVPPEQRHPNLSFSHHQEVQNLEPDEQDRMLNLAEQEGWTREELRDQVRKAKRTAAKILAASQPVPELVGDLVTIELGDATRLPLDFSSVDLIITSPPYGLDKRYGAHEDTAAAWSALMLEFLLEAFRVAKPGGRLAVNIPLDTTLGGFRPTYAELVNLAIRVGWTYRFTIDWHEGNVSKSVARGSVDSPGAPHVMTRAEMLPVFCKGDWKRAGAGLTTDLEHEEWLAWTDGAWDFGGEAAPWEGFEAAFPPELPYRAMKLLSFQQDVVCDPFAGSGTSLVVAQRLGRRCYGYDNDQAQVDSIKRRLAAARSLGRE